MLSQCFISYILTPIFNIFDNLITPLIKHMRFMMNI